MLKKILPFLCSLAPLYAFGADSIVIPTNPATIDIQDNQYANISSGVGVTVSGTVDVGGNLMVLNTAVEQTPTLTSGDLYILNTAGNASGVFGITSGGNLSVVGNVGVDATRGLKLSGAVDMSVGGDVLSTGSFAVENANSLSITGAITSADMLSLQAGQITIDGNVSQSSFGSGVAAASQKLNIETTSGALSVGDIATSAQVATITSATTITSSGAIQNAVGNMTITSHGNLTTVDNVENNGARMTINTGSGATQIGGTLNNTLAGGELFVTSGALSADSLVNSGTATFNITGLTSFANGMNLSGMAATSVLSLTTGTLSLGSNKLIANEKSSVVITVDSGALDAGTVKNGALGGISNDSAQMVLSGVGVTLTTVQNYGHLLTIGNTTQTTNDDITISSDVMAAAGTQTNINAYDTLQVNGSVDNAGNMTLAGKTTNLAGVTNSGSGSVLNVGSMANGASVHVSGAVLNDGGTTTIASQGVALDGSVTNASGTLNINGAGLNNVALSAGSLLVNGGVVNLNSWAGGVQTGTLSVSGGVLNLGNTVYQLNSTGNIEIGGNVYLAAASNSGSKDVRLTATGGNIILTSGGVITVAGDVIATDNSARTATFDGTTIYVNGTNGVNVQNGGYVRFGTDSLSTLDVASALSATNGGKIEIYSGTVSSGSLTQSGNGLVKMHSGSLVVDNGAISIGNGIYFDGSSTNVGLVIDSSLGAFELQNTSNNDVTISGGISLASGKSLTINSGHDAIISGNVSSGGALSIVASNAATFSNSITTSGSATPALSVNAKTISIAGITNNAATELVATNGTITSTAVINNSGSLSATATGNISLTDISSSGDVNLASSAGNVTTTGGVSVTGGNFGISGNTITVNMLSLTGGTTTVSATQKLAVNSALGITGNLVQGSGTDVLATSGTLKLVNTPRVEASSLDISSGEFIVKSGTTDYVITGAADLGNALSVASGATTQITASAIDMSGDITNQGTLSLTTTGAATGVNVGNIKNQSGLTINTNGSLIAKSFKNEATATATITSSEMNLSNPADIQKALTVANNLYQNYTGALAGGDVTITNSNYTITATGISVGGNFEQVGNSAMIMNTSDVTVGGNINATNLTIAATPATTWSTIAVGGNLSGGVKIYGLEHMTVGGDYTFDDDSLLHAAVLPYATVPALNTTTNNYWASVSLNDDSSFGQITNAEDANPLISVNGRFITDITSVPDAPDNAAMVAPQMGITLYDTVDQGTAIWLLHANGGLNDLATKIRNLNVNFCNASGTICFNYIDAYTAGTSEDLPLYLSVRDNDGDGVTDSLYIVFNPEVGGPVTVFDTDSIVERLDDATDGMISAAGALDDMVSGQLNNAGFYNTSPIETIPLAFAGTNLSGLADALYNRMEQYTLDFDG
ncbi:MAG: hypothetical protein J5679_00125, partial [Alphaproteobacteria bacterium]|nr:hypothetical protein [Alphaproteobacteria bacterium]